MAIRKAKGFRLEVTLLNGERAFRNFEMTRDQLQVKVLDRIGRFNPGFKEVHSVNPHEWEQEYMSVNLL